MRSQPRVNTRRARTQSLFDTWLVVSRSRFVFVCVCFFFFLSRCFLCHRFWVVSWGLTNNAKMCHFHISAVLVFIRVLNISNMHIISQNTTKPFSHIYSLNWPLLLFFLNFRSFPQIKGQMWSYTEHFKLWWDVNWNVFFFIFNQISCMKVVAFWLWVTLEKVQEPDSSFPSGRGLSSFMALPPGVYMCVVQHVPTPPEQ